VVLIAAVVIIAIGAAYWLKKPKPQAK